MHEAHQVLFLHPSFEKIFATMKVIAAAGLAASAVFLTGCGDCTFEYFSVAHANETNKDWSTLRQLLKFCWNMTFEHI